MASFNKVLLMGNLTRDPELSYTPSNTPVCEFGMAVNRKWRGQDGNAKEEVCFVDVVAYGKTAEVVNQYMSKGRPLFIEGRLKFEQWTDRDGKSRSKLRVVMESMQFLPDGRREGGQPREQDEPEPQRRAAGTQDNLPPEDPDIPF